MNRKLIVLFLFGLLVLPKTVFPSNAFSGTLLDALSGETLVLNTGAKDLYTCPHLWQIKKLLIDKVAGVTGRELGKEEGDLDCSSFGGYLSFLILKVKEFSPYVFLRVEDVSTFKGAPNLLDPDLHKRMWIYLLEDDLLRIPHKD